MNSRARLLAALNGQIPDRVPILTYELVGYNSRAWENHEPSYARLMDAIRAKTDCICMWNPRADAVFLASAYPVPIDVETVREGHTTVTHRIIHTPEGDLTSTTKVLDGLHTVWHVERPCKSTADVGKALSVPYVPLNYDTSDYARIKREVGDHGIIMASLSDPLLMAADLMEFGAYTVWAMTETPHFARTVDTMHERCMENLRRMLDANVVDVYRICGPEYATPPYLPPAFFQRFVVPYVTAMVDLIHSRGAKVRFHCHGKIRQVLDMIVATGADGLDPCEGPPDGNIPLGALKARLEGTGVSIFGNLQLKLLEHGTVDEVEATVRACMRAAKAGGGYVIMPTAAPVNIPLAKQTEENYLRFIDTALAYGKY
jgi:uroporphyrinogen-III decarboxylase